jgi:UDP-glucose 4-epimerase
VKKILITGANGFLALHILKRLNSNYSYVCGLVKSASNLENCNNYKKIYDNVDDLLKYEKEFDIIFHCASYIPYHNENTPCTELIAVNVHLTSALALNYDSARFIYTSSISVYGQPIDLPIKISSPFNNPNLYGLSKLASESIVRNLRSYAIIRFTSLIGLGMKDVSFIPKVINRAKEFGEITLIGDGERLQDYIDVRDAARLCTIMADFNQNEIVLGVSGNPLSNNDILKSISVNTGIKINQKGIDNSSSFYYDVENTFKTIGFVPKYSILKTIKNMIEL